MTEREHDTLVHNLAAALGGKNSEVIQTHISSVILAGDEAYKLKKPVDFGFLDYATIERRKRFCEEEVRINGRYASQLYLGVVAVTGSIDAPRIDARGEAIEYAVKMRRFASSDRLDVVVQTSGLSDTQCDGIAEMAAQMHLQAAVVEKRSDFGTPGRVLVPMKENFDLMASLDVPSQTAEAIRAIEAWTLAEHARLAPMLSSRKQGGFVRECHGDMHLHNMVLFEGLPRLFDAIEFNPYLNHIDVISDLAFLLMDLEYRGLRGQSRRILNAYLEQTGDYDAVALLAFYKTYRAMVRAKVLALHAAQDIPAAEKAAAAEAVERYVALASSYRNAGESFLAITHGISGSGKSTFALEIVQRFGALRLRSDAERIRLFRGEDAAGDIYTSEVTERTYARLLGLSRGVITDGSAVVVDATFLQYAQRKVFERLAGELEVPMVIVDIECDETELLRRVALRKARHNDISEADGSVVQLQQAAQEPLREAERAFRLVQSCHKPFDAEALETYLDKRRG